MAVVSSVYGVADQFVISCGWTLWTECGQFILGFTTFYFSLMIIVLNCFSGHLKKKKASVDNFNLSPMVIPFSLSAMLQLFKNQRLRI